MATSEASYVVVARHGERLDYSMRDKGENWTCTAARPFDTPLTTHGKQQGRMLGEHLATTMMRDLKLPTIAGVYSSPLLRCRQTAAMAVRGLRKHNVAGTLKVQVEEGLLESVNSFWYQSWALPGSDGTWGYLPSGADRSQLDPSTFHSLAKQPVSTLLDWQSADRQESPLEADVADLLDGDYQTRSTIEPSYSFHPRNLESGGDQRKRMLSTVQTLLQPNKTVVLVSHGGPVTHLYEQITGNSWRVHGESSYCCFSLYKFANGKWEALAVNESDYLHENVVTEQHISENE